MNSSPPSRWPSWLASFYCIILLCIGAFVTGIVAVLVSYLFDHGSLWEQWVFKEFRWLSLMVTPLLAVVLAWCTRKVFMYSEGSGIPQVIASLMSQADHSKRSQLFTWRVMMGKFLLAPIAIVAGMSLGREGPTVQMGACIMYGVRQFYRRHSEFWDKVFIMAGGGAGLAAAFNAPVAGLVFAIEELAGHFWKRTILLLLLAIAIALEGVHFFHGDTLHFGHIVTRPGGWHFWHVVPAVLLIGTVCGVASGFFNWLLFRCRPWQQRVPLRLAFMCGLMVAILNLVTDNATFGDGKDPAYALLHGFAEPQWTYGIAKWLSTFFTYLCGIPGGLFSPSLSAAAGLAAAFHGWLPGVSVPELALLGMVGYMAGMTQSPITALVITLEMTGNHSFAIPLVAVAFVGAGVAKQIAPGLYETLATIRYASSVNR